MVSYWTDNGQRERQLPSKMETCQAKWKIAKGQLVGSKWADNSQPVKQVAMWYFALLFAVVATSISSAQHDDEPIIFVVRAPEQLGTEVDDSLLNYWPSREIFTKRAIPFNGGMYGKRSTMPFSGGMYGKRSAVGTIFAQRRAAIPFSGGMYGKRSVSASYENNENQIKRGAMPFSGGMYGR
uniref:Neuropeptide-Like Protein n=1 Tax=Caenorhabditis japonica TaxID=281687 RepID=A0A8R1DW48_CAEJA